MNGYAVKVLSMELRRSRNPQHASRNIKDSVVLSKRTGIRKLKTEFMQYMSKRDGHPFTGQVGSFDEEWRQAMEVANNAKSKPLAVVLAFRKITRNWQFKSNAFNNLAVALLRFLAHSIRIKNCSPTLTHSD